ncbi:acyl-CoA dehydratase activase-related protein [Alkaliphilus crotonatoxidans]
MKIKIGIPRGLWYYDYFPLWKAFYENLGAEVVVSSPTNKKILDRGVKSTVDEACLPVKIFHGHVLDLKDRVDYIFVPKMMSVYQNEYICPKFCGLPEMVSHSIKDLPPLIDDEINFNKSRKHLMKTIYRFGSYVNNNPLKIYKAYQNALLEYRTYHDRLRQGYIPVNGNLMKQKSSSDHKRKKIALLGHPYHLYDSFSSMSIINKLTDYNVEIITPEMMSLKTINQLAGTLEKKIFWSYGRKVLGTALQLEQGQGIDGAIYVSAFGCGIDSVVAELFERWTKNKAALPFLLITIDEHTGEAGVNTRLEAFIDMIDWRKRNEGNFPAHG